MNTKNIVVIKKLISLFRVIFIRLKHTKLFPFYSEKFINILDKILVDPSLYRLRIQLISVIEGVCVSEYNFKQIQRLYVSLAQKVKVQPSLRVFTQYLLDMSGIIKEINRISKFKIFMELCMGDWYDLFRMFLSQSQIHESFKN